MFPVLFPVRSVQIPSSVHAQMKGEVGQATAATSCGRRLADRSAWRRCHGRFARRHDWARRRPHAEVLGRSLLLRMSDASYIVEQPAERFVDACIQLFRRLTSHESPPDRLPGAIPDRLLGRPRGIARGDCPGRSRITLACAAEAGADGGRVDRDAVLGTVSRDRDADDIECPRTAREGRPPGAECRTMWDARLRA